MFPNAGDMNTNFTDTWAIKLEAYAEKEKEYVIPRCPDGKLAY